MGLEQRQPPRTGCARSGLSGAAAQVHQLRLDAVAGRQPHVLRHVHAVVGSGRPCGLDLLEDLLDKACTKATRARRSGRRTARRTRALEGPSRGWRPDVPPEARVVLDDAVCSIRRTPSAYSRRTGTAAAGRAREAREQRRCGSMRCRSASPPERRVARQREQDRQLDRTPSMTWMAVSASGWRRGCASEDDLAARQVLQLVDELAVAVVARDPLVLRLRVRGACPRCRTAGRAARAAPETVADLRQVADRRRRPSDRRRSRPRRSSRSAPA
jgi:hypothetical protein